jgi:thiol-disulfide isomerase/thioredoxin
MRKLLMRKLTLIFLLALFVACVPARSVQAQRITSITVEDAEPELNLQGIDGKTYSLATMRGNVLLVSFGATWCQPCRDELAALEELKVEYQGKPVKFLWVNIESPEELPDKKLKSFVKSNKLTFPVLRDPSKFTFAQFSSVVRMPMVVFFDKDSKFKAPKQTGMASQEMYKARIRLRLDQLLATQGRARLVNGN